MAPCTNRLKVFVRSGRGDGEAPWPIYSKKVEGCKTEVFYCIKMRLTILTGNVEIHKTHRFKKLLRFPNKSNGKNRQILVDRKEAERRKERE